MNVVRWRRHGNDRLYVTGDDGTRLGWHDLVSGESHITDSTQTAAFHTTIAQWRAKQPDAGTQPRSTPHPTDYTLDVHQPPSRSEPVDEHKTMLSIADDAAAPAAGGATSRPAG